MRQNALFVMSMLTLLEIIRLGVVVMGIEFTNMTLRDALFSAAQSAALRRELPSLIPDSHSRPADVFLPSWKGGALDITVISTLQQLTVQGAATVQGHALLLGEERKLSAHTEACRSVFHTTGNGVSGGVE